MTIYSDVSGEAGETCPGVGARSSSSSSGDDVVDPDNLKEDDLGRNLSIARVAGGGNEECIMSTGVGRCAREAVYSADSSISKPSSAASTLWSLALVPRTKGSLRASRKMNKSFELICNFPFISGSAKINTCSF
jgi:hypothetical protein